KMSQQSTSNDRVSTATGTIEETDSCQQIEASEIAPTLQLRLEPPRDERRVVFHEGVIDNEHMNRMKSKCCCIYKKPMSFGESSSEEDGECEHCFGHPEKRKKNTQSNPSEPRSPTRHTDEPSTSSEALSQISQSAPEKIDKEVYPNFESSAQP
ncbi:hypothetical protein KR044_005643, partial [Drosophila immigrans]